MKKFADRPAVDLLLVCSLFACALLAYWPALHGTLLWDDLAHVTAPALQSLHGLGRIWTEVGATQQYYPLLHSAFWLEHRLWRDDTVGYHLVNIVEHTASAFLVYAIVQRLGLRGSVFAAFIFALHPVAVESVAWISEQKNTLSGLFYLAALFVYLGFDENRKGNAYALASVLFVAALMTKTVTATLPAALGCIFWWRRGRLEWERDVAPLLPWLLVGLVAGSFSALFEKNLIGAEGADFSFSFTQRCLLAGKAFWFYLGKAVWPANLTFIYPRWSAEEISRSYLPLSAGIVLAVIAVILARKRRAPLTVALIFAGTLFPVLGFVNVYPFLFSYVADHFQYLALLALIVPFSAGLQGLAEIGGTFARWLAVGVVVLVCLSLGRMTWLQSHEYTDSVTLYRATLRLNPGCWMAHNNLANIYSQSPATLPLALAEYKAALAQRPDWAETHFNYANALAKISERLPEAIDHYRTAVTLQPNFADAYNNLGKALVGVSGPSEKAGRAFAQAIAIDPNLSEAHANLGTLYSKIPGHLPDAVDQYKIAAQLDPVSPELHFNLGLVLSRIPGRRSEAIAEYVLALKLRPDMADAHFNLANLLVAEPGRKPEAIAHYQAALKREPDRIAVREILKTLQVDRQPGTRVLPSGSTKSE